MENIIEIYNLLPEEIMEVIEKLTDALNIVKNKKNTNSKLVDKIKDKKECPYCQSANIIKNGHNKNKVQTYKCKDCKKKFNACNVTLASHIKLTIFFECMNDKLSIRKTAAKMEVNQSTVFLLRHKV